MILTAEEIADKLNIQKDSVYRLAKKLKFEKVGNNWLFTKKQLDLFLKTVGTRENYRQNELRGIGYINVTEIAEKLFIHRVLVSIRIKKLELIPFERYYYSEEQIEMIKNYRL